MDRKPEREPERAPGTTDDMSASEHVREDRIPPDAERTLEREEERGIPRADNEPDVAERLK